MGRAGGIGAARRRGRAMGAGLVLAVLGAPAGASAAPAALPPLDVSVPGSTAMAPRVGMDGEGGLVVLWQERRAGAVAVVAATRAPAESPAPPVPLSPAGTAVGGPALAVAPSGRALAAWWRDGDAGTVVQVAERLPGGAFPAGVDVSPAGGFSPQVAVASDGGAIVAWLRFIDGQGTVVEASLRPPGGAFGPPVPVSQPGQDAFAPQVALGDDGRVAVAWTRSDGARMRIQAALGTVAGGLTPARTLSAAGQDAYDPRIALVPGGALTAWTRSDGTNARVQSTVLPPAGDAPAADTLSAPGADADGPQIAVDATGAGIVAWRRGGMAGGRVQVAARAADGGLAAALDLSPPATPVADVRAAVDAGGRAIVAWRRADAVDPRVQASVRPAGGPFGAPVDLSARGAVPAEPGVAVDGAGNGAVVWRRAAGDDDVVQIAGIDDAPPVLLDLVVPAAAVAGEPLRLGVRPRDVWSPLAPGPTWSFSPQEGAVGASVEHAFAAAGTYAVRVVQADVGGRVVVAERRVDVSPAAPATTLRLPQATPPAARRPVALRLALTPRHQGARAWVRVRGTTARALAGRALIVERRGPRGALVLCRVPVRARGGFDRSCRVDAFARRDRVDLRLRVRLAATATTLARRTPWVRVRVDLRPGVARRR